jgi:hypothetical protein
VAVAVAVAELASLVLLAVTEYFIFSTRRKHG